MSPERYGETRTEKPPCGEFGQRVRNARWVHPQVAMRLATIAAALVYAAAGQGLALPALGR